MIDTSADLLAQLQQATCTRTDGERSVVLSLSLVSGMLCFKGHFPDRPILPGVVQVHWVMGLAKQLAEHCKCDLGAFAELSRVKFMRAIQPDICLDLALEFKAKHSITFRYFDQQHIYSSGRLVFHPPS